MQSIRSNLLLPIGRMLSFAESHVKGSYYLNLHIYYIDG